MKKHRLQFTDYLLNQKILTETDLDAAYIQQKKNRGKLTTVLIENGYVTELNLMEAVAQYWDVPFVNLKTER